MSPCGSGHLPDLVRTGHGDEQVLAVNEQGPGAVQSRFGAGRVGPLRSPGLLAGAGDRGDVLLFQIDLAEQVILGIGDVERFAVERQPWG